MSGIGDIRKDFNTKYTDSTIRRRILTGSPITAQAMIAYNEMIDTRWARYYGEDMDGAEAYFVKFDEREE